MKIALIRRQFTAFGGAELYVSALARRLVDRGHEVHILARQWEESPGEGLIFHRISSRGGPSSIRLLSFARAAAVEVEAGDYDLVHSFERTYSQDVFRAGDGCHREWLNRRAEAYGTTAARLDRINPRHRTFLYLEKRLFTDPGLKLVIANSRAVRDEIIRHYSFPGDRIKIIYNGLDRTRFHPGLRDEHRAIVRRELGLSMEEPAALFVGSGYARKGLADVIRAMAALRNGLKLLVAGRDRIKPYRELARKLALTGSVLFLGPRMDVDRLYGAVDVFVLPSLYEPFSNACLEAMAAGLPVVTSERTGAAEVVENGANGYITELPAKVEDLAGKIGMSLDLDRGTVIEANEKILTPFDWELNLDQTIEAYDSIERGSARA